MRDFSSLNQVDLNLINLQGQVAPLELIKKSERAYKKQITDAVKTIIENPSIRIVLIAGPSSAGKTTSANLLKINLEKKGKHAFVISMDNFFIDRVATPRLPDGSYDFENVQAVDIPFFKNFIHTILSKNNAKMPIFDFVEGVRKKELIDISLPLNTVLIIEGIHALNPLFIDNHESELFRIFVCINTEFYLNDKIVIENRELRRMRRMIRDLYARGISVEETIARWNNVCLGEELYILPFKNNADYVLDSTHYYEPLMYKKYLPPLLDGSEISKKIEEDLKYCYKLDASLIPSTSLINEFLEGVIGVRV